MWSQVGRGAALLGQRAAVPVAVSLRKSRGEVWLVNRWEAGGMVKNKLGR